MNTEQLDVRVLNRLTWWQLAMLGFIKKPVNTIFHIVIGYAYERSIINSFQMHEILGILNRVFSGEKP